MLPRAEQKLQTRQALLDAACQLMESGRGFGSISLREVAKAAGIVPTGFYRHFTDMDALGLALVAEVDATFRQTIRIVRHNEFELGGITDASVRIFWMWWQPTARNSCSWPANSTVAPRPCAKPLLNCARASAQTRHRPGAHAALAASGRRRTGSDGRPCGQDRVRHVARTDRQP